MTAIIAAVVIARVEFIDARHSNCELLKQVLYAATPANRINRANELITVTPLHDCNKYAGTFIP